MIVGSDIAITRRRVALPSVHGTDEKNKSADASGPILQDHIEQWLYRRLGTKPETTRIRFEDRFAKLLQTSTQGRVVEVSEIGRSLKINLRVTIYEGDRIIEDQTLRVDVDVQRLVRVAVEQIKRRTILSNDHSIIEKRWISPAMAIRRSREIDRARMQVTDQARLDRDELDAHSSKCSSNAGSLFLQEAWSAGSSSPELFVL